MKNTNQRLGGLRMEDLKGVQGPQTFPVMKLAFLHSPLKHDDWCAFKWVLNTDHELKAASWTLEKKMYIVASKLNSTFGMIGNAMADKMTEFGWEKLGAFSWRETHLQNFEQSFAFK